MSHELGHLLMGWPDLYDTDYSSAGTGDWDLMAGGSWNGGGDRPAHPTAWCKTKAGWVTPTTVFNAAQTVTIQPYATNAAVYKLPIGSAASTEYFLVSNRQQTGFDDDLPGAGCVIEHVDDTRTSNRRDPLSRGHRPV
jgi:immune inhibitor A